MAGKSLPKPCSKTALNKKYQLLAIETKGRLDIVTEKGRTNIDLLRKYYNAFSNLYGAIILDDAWDIFKLVEKTIISKKQILKKDFLAFSEVARYEAHNYFILEIDELYEAEKRGGAVRRFIVNKKLYKKGYSRFDFYYRLADEQLNHPLCVLDRDELLSWDDPGMLWRSAEGTALKLFVESLSVDNESANRDIHGEKIAGKRLKDFVFWHDSEDFAYSYAKREWEKKELEEYQNVVESEKILRSIERYINSAVLYTEINKQIEFILTDLQEVGVCLTEQQFKTFFRLYSDFSNNSRKWPLSGWKPVELSRLYNYFSKPSISFGKNMQQAFEDGSINKDELMEGIRKLGVDVVDE